MPKSHFKGLFKIAGFFLLVMFLALVLDQVISHGLRQITTSKFGAFNKVISGMVNAEVVINGSSRALNHYDPRIIKSVTGLSCYNLGMNASQIDFQVAVLKAYLKHNAKPKIVIQNLDLFSFETTRAGEIYDPGYYIPYLYEDEIYNALLKIDSSVWKWKHIPLYGYAVEDMRFSWVSGIAAYFGSYSREDYVLGFNPRHSMWTQDFERFSADNPNGITYRIEPKGVSALRELIQICTEREIKLILVYSPEYYEMQALELNRAKIFDTFRELAKSSNVILWDFSDSKICQDRKFFSNSQHLNAAGAEAFSKDLAGKIVSDPVLAKLSTVGLEPTN